MVHAVGTQANPHHSLITQRVSKTVGVSRAEPSIECQWCEAKEGTTTGSEIPVFGWLNTLEYRTYASVALFAASFYGVGIPYYFFTIMYRAKHDRTDGASAATGKLKHGEFIKRYGFLTSKMRDDFYFWEVSFYIKIKPFFNRK